MATIDRWTDAFLIFLHVNIQRHPCRKAAELLQYMFIIRDAARKFPGMDWRNYDE